jgi:N-acetylglucosaminyl-diphospho-decaprenol L-rhamnosyltransferase
MCARVSADARERSYGGVNAEGSTSETRMGDDCAVKVTYCVVNTNGREHLHACIGAIQAQHPQGVEAELLVLDNRSDDGSAERIAEIRAELEAGGKYPAGLPELVQPERRQGKAANDTLLLQRARGEYCLLLNEDSELLTGATAALISALDAHPEAGAAGAQLYDPAGEPQPCAWRLPGMGTALAQALFLHKWLVTQSGGTRTRRVGWAQSAAMLVRRSAAERVDYLDPDVFVYSDETDFCKRLGDAGFPTLYVPEARAVHHEQLSTDRGSGERRIVEFHRNRDLYMRKHHGPVAAFAVRALTAFSYLPRALVALVLPGHDPHWYLLHSRKAWSPSGEGIREAVERATPAE